MLTDGNDLCAAAAVFAGCRFFGGYPITPSSEIMETLIDELPVIMVTALDPAVERVKGIEAGADDFLSKPINQAELLARVKSLLRIKELHDTVQAQARELADWNRTLEQRVQKQLEQLERLERLKRFFSP